MKFHINIANKAPPISQTLAHDQCRIIMYNAQTWKKSLFKTIYQRKVNPAVHSATLVSVCMSAVEDCTRLRVLHLSSVKIYETQRQRSAAFSLTDSPFTCPLTPSIFSLWSFPPGSGRPSWRRGTGQLLSVSITLCYSSACAFCLLHMCVIAAKQKIDERPLAGLEQT